MTETILVAIDLEHVGHNVIDTAREIAQWHNGKMVFVTVLPPVPPAAAVFLPSEFVGDATGKSRARLGEQVRQHGLEPQDDQLVVLHGAPYDEIIRMADEVDANLIVIGSHAPTASDYLLGSVAAKVVRHAPCSVYVVRPPKQGK
jgi:nucleotide-binding universal stress UspA family protein